MRLSYLLLCAVLLAGSCTVALGAREQTLDDTVKRFQGSWSYSDEDVSIGGRIYHGWGRPLYNVQFDVRDFDWFEAQLGCDGRWGDVGALIVRVGGQPVGRYTVKKGEKAKFLRTPSPGSRPSTY